MNLLIKDTQYLYHLLITFIFMTLQTKQTQTKTNVEGYAKKNVDSSFSLTFNSGLIVLLPSPDSVLYVLVWQ